MEAEILRKLFRLKFPDLKTLKQAEIHRLIWILDEELETHAKQGNLVMTMIPLNRFVAKMIREKGIEYRGLELKVRAHYFECGREAVTFRPDGNIWFCGWAGGSNPDPFLRGVRRWLETKKEANHATGV